MGKRDQDLREGYCIKVLLSRLSWQESKCYRKNHLNERPRAIMREEIEKV